MIQRLLIKTRTLTQGIKYNHVDQWDEHYIRPYNIQTPKQYKNLYKKQKQLRPFPMVRANFYDALHMPGLDQSRMLQIQKQILTKGQIVISNQFVAMLMYHLSKNKLMLQRTMQILQDWVPRHKGQYTARQVFGCLYGSIIYNRRKHINFFLEQKKASGQQFQLAQTVQIIQALNKNTHMTLDEKHKFWQQHFKQVFLDNMHRVNGGYVTVVFRIFQAFKQFQYYDEQIWDRIFVLMDNKGGWVRTTILEKIYPLTGTFQKAKLLFDKYYTQISTNRNIQWRYNLQQLRMYTSQQMIAKSQQNIQINPTFRTMLPKDKVEKMTEKYQHWLVHGSVKEDEQIIKDKSTSFGYAIKDRFESLTKDNVDFSKLTKKEFEQLFGEYDEQLMKDKEEAVVGEQSAEEQVEQAVEENVQEQK